MTIDSRPLVSTFETLLALLVAAVDASIAWTLLDLCAVVRGAHGRV
jgi:hypothetical protein